MQLQTVADIVPNSAAVAVAAGQRAVWVELVATGSKCRYGDANVGAARGAKLPTGVPVLVPRCDFNQGGYDLGALYVYGEGSDAISVTWGS